MQHNLTNSLVQFHFLQETLRLNQRAQLKSFLEKLFRKEGVQLTSLQYIFCSDKYLLDINRRFLQHDYYTDIITFNLAGGLDAVEGEVYISLDRVRENAMKLKQPLYRELHRVIFHGALHLCGYKDKRKKEIELMRQMEELNLREYFKK